MAEPSPTASPFTAIQQFLKHESVAGLLLVSAAVVAVVLVNSPFGAHYDGILGLVLSVSLGDIGLSKPLLLWINDGLMAVFFLLVGLEIKREVLEGELSSPAQAALPAIAALGGMAVPAAIYVAINWGDPRALVGWAIPSATDIAFTLGALSLLGGRVPLALKVFLTAVAILDDLGAIVIIAIFYTADLSVLSLGLAVAALVGLVLLNRFGVRRVGAYVVVGVILWICVLKSGVHATLAGVALALAIPLTTRDEDGHSLLRHLEHVLHPWVTFGVLPVFAFANAGLSFIGLDPGAIMDSVPLGIALGLFVGKSVGIFVAAWISVRLGLARLPEGVDATVLLGGAVLCGIGFTMSLFIGSLAFGSEAMLAEVRLGVFAGSLVSGAVGCAVIGLATRQTKRG